MRNKDNCNVCEDDFTPKTHAEFESDYQKCIDAYSRMCAGHDNLDMCAYWEIRRDFIVKWAPDEVYNEK
jgi:hypothetical protein